MLVLLDGKIFATIVRGVTECDIFEVLEAAYAADIIGVDNLDLREGLKRSLTVLQAMIVDQI